MAEVIDIVHQLTYQVNDQSLIRAVDAIKINIQNIGTLQATLASLEQRLQNTARSDIQTQRQLQAEIDRTRQRIDANVASIDRTIAGNNRLAQSIRNLASVNNQTNGGAGNTAINNRASFVATDLGRLVQDAPYAAQNFGSIANNINPLFESFQRLVRETGSVGGAFRALAGTLTSVGGLGFAISVVTSLWTSFGDSIKEAFTGAKTSTEAFNEQFEKATQTASSNIGKFDILVATLQNESATRDEINDAIRELQQMYPAYLSNLTAENRLTQEITDALSNQRTQIQGIAIKTAAQETYKEALKRTLEEQAKFDRDAKGNSSGEFFKSLIGTIGELSGNTTEDLYLLEQANNDLEKSIKESSKAFERAKDPITTYIKELEEVQRNSTLTIERLRPLTFFQGEYRPNSAAAGDIAYEERKIELVQQRIDQLKELQVIQNKEEFRLSQAEIVLLQRQASLALTSEGQGRTQAEASVIEAEAAVEKNKLLDLYTQKYGIRQADLKDNASYNAQLALIEARATERLRKLYKDRQVENNLAFQLRKEIIAEQKKLDEQELRRIDPQDDNVIRKRTENQLKASNEALNERIAQAKKEGKLTSEVASLFEKLRIKQEQEIKEEGLYNLSVYFSKRAEAAISFYASERKLSLDNAKAALKIDVDLQRETLEQRRRVAELERQVDFDLLQQTFKQIEDKAKSAGLSVEEITRQKAEAQTNYERIEADKRLSIYEDEFQQQKRNIERIRDARISGNIANNSPISAIVQNDIEKIEALRQVLEEANKAGAALVNDDDFASKDIDTYKRKLDEAAKGINDAQNNLDKAQRELFIKTLNGIQEINSEATKLVQTIARALIDVYEMQDGALERSASQQQKRIDFLVKTSERGNAELLRQEQERLNKIQEERDKIAKKQIELNRIVTLSEQAKSLAEAIGAVVKAASGGDPYTIAPRIIAAVAALVGGVATIKGAFQTEAFAEGVVDYKGKGTSKSDSNLVRISRGESVITADATQKYAPMLRAMNMGIPITKYVTGGSEFATRNELKMLGKKLDTLNETMSINKTVVHSNITDSGIRVATEKSQRANTRLWS